MARWTPLVAVLGVVALAGGAALASGYTVDKNRTADLRELLREADRVATQPPDDDPLTYFTMHGQLASAAGVEHCSIFATRMTQRFLPPEWHFHPDDLAALEARRPLKNLRLDTGDPPMWNWQC